jgi:hypothetical protein
MKRKMLWVLLASLILVGIMVAGCNKGGSISSSPSAPAQNQNGGSAANTNQGAAQASQWPSQMPPDVPKFTYGTITGFGSTSNSIVVFINNASPDSFDKYQSDLKNAGWTIKETSQINGYGINAAKGERRVTVTFGSNSSSGNELQGQVLYNAIVNYGENQ